jgi:polyphosphate kinase 2 (PPK2 family)
MQSQTRPESVAPSSFGEDEDSGGPKLKRKDYEKELRKLQGDLCDLQAWVKNTGQRIIVVFEGRDAAGKGGTIRALTERVIGYRPTKTLELAAASSYHLTLARVSRWQRTV